MIVLLLLLTVLGLNTLLYYRYKKNVIEYQKSLVLKRVELCGAYIEKTVSKYENDLTRILFKNFKELPEIFEDGKVFTHISLDLQGLYSKNRDLISNISVFDDADSYLGIYIKDNDELVIDTFPQQFYNDLESKDIIVKNKGYYKSYFPFFRNNSLTGNVVVEINLEKYINSIFSLFQLEGLQWQWVASTESKVMMINFPDSINIYSLDKISEGIDNEEIFSLEHYYTGSDGKKKQIVSAVYPLNVLNNDLGIVFTIETGQLTKLFLLKYHLLTVFSLLIMILLMGVLVYAFQADRKKQLKRSSDLLSLKMIIEHFPVGIMITDSLGTIKNINRTGQKMLFIEKDEDITGHKLANQLLVSNKYLLKEGSASFDSHHFIHYEKDGNEIVIYRKDIKAQIAGEELTISALIDVSSLEKSRKQEAAANSAKSDFLAKMSHEIRTPMSGILSMTEDLIKNKLSESQREQVMVIKRSGELLLNIINDILDFSKIEAGKMLLEEIPFSLKEELEYCLSLYRSMAKEKGLLLENRINSDVPDRLIGDPLRIRQVISNLITNSIKFTDEGKVITSVSLMERDNGTLSLLFSVEDTGIGIPKENQKSIFQSYEQSNESISRNYGGTGLGMVISKQLVELMNGQIWVESPVYSPAESRYPGSRISFTAEVYSNERIQKKFDFSHIQKFHQITAFIISSTRDDDDKTHLLLDRFGVNYNYLSLEETSLEEAIRHLEEKRSLYQMIILIDKPGQDGFMLAQHLKENKLLDYYPVILVTSHNQHGNYLRARSLGIDYYLIQPFESIEIYSVFRENFPGLSDYKGVSSQVNKLRSHINILLAEDNIINQQIAQSVFKHLGFEIDIAKNGKEAIEMSVLKKYDIIFMDLLMPEVDGLAATHEIRKTYPDLPIIAFTAADESDKKNEAYHAGITKFLSKPIKVERIKEILISYFSEGLA